MWLIAAALAISAVPAETRQLVLSVSSGWEVTGGRIRLFERDSPSSPWQPVGTGFEVSLGRTGMGWGRGLQPANLAGPVKREGDGRSPAGIFDLRLATGYGPAPAGTRLTYRLATAELKCVDDPASPHYNKLVNESLVEKDWTSAEEMRRYDELYRLVVWVGHNDAPAEPGAGSCIFLHLRGDPQTTTAGCTAFELEPMQRLLRWLDPAARPVLVQLPAAILRDVASGWGLPAGP
jgi:L,D-peptidoglycan transpeptidase YkuD (ErfK/YbiS/YcfS/YnhG family)